jgi:hypothetical protein
MGLAVPDQLTLVLIVESAVAVEKIREQHTFGLRVRLPSFFFLSSFKWWRAEQVLSLG